MRRGQIDQVRRLLDEGAGAKLINGALIRACYNGDVEVARLLLERGADPSFRGNASLVESSRRGYLDVVLLLLDSGAEVDATHDGGWTGLMCACRLGHVDMVRLLLEYQPYYRRRRVDTVDTGLQAEEQRGCGGGVDCQWCRCEPPRTQWMVCSVMGLQS